MYGRVPQADPHTARSTYWLSDQEVDHFKYEVTATQVCSMVSPLLLIDLNIDMQVGNMVLDAGAYDDDWETIPTPEASDVFNCVDHWQNAWSNA